MSANPAKTPRHKPAPVIILTGGGSGGHITPLLSLAHELKAQRPSCKIIYIGLKGEKVEGLQNQYQVFDQVYHIAAGKFRRYYGQSFLAHLGDVKTQALNSRDFFRVIKGLHSAEKIVKAVKPDVVFSKGGYVAVPVGLAAKLNAVPIVTHDSDSVPGLANRLAGRWAVVHATGMPVEYYNYGRSKTVYTGVPVDKRVRPLSTSLQRSYKKKLGIPADSLVLLAAGGGQGAQQINDLMLAAAPKLLAQFPKLYILHFAGIKLAGQMGVERVRELYHRLLSDSKRVQVLDFSGEFYKYSGAADLIITRAGATVMSEFAVQGKACIVIPSAVLAGGHQLKNSQVLAAQKAAVVLPADVTAGRLLKLTSNLLKSPAKRKLLAKNLGSTAQPQAARKLAALIIEVAEKSLP
ncbi:MAG TPA: glycosyltransferase [Candidatus Nitrosopolaris sp.]|nr:glycosyltransferase [Candidatus Nitrosopolaris sp.]